MTPAMASEPYCADAPSRRISMFSIADAGNGVQIDAARAAADGVVRVHSPSRCARTTASSTRTRISWAR